jgi:hypothetical protein
MCREGARKLGCNRTMNCFEKMTSKNGIINDPRKQNEDVGMENPSESVD